MKRQLWLEMRLFTHSLLGLICFTHCVCAQDIFNNDSSSTSFDHPILQLINFQMSYCKHLEWCTITNVAGENTPSCCKPCACDHQCYRRRDCCPDYEFSKVWPGDSFSNISAFMKEISDWNSTVDNTTINTETPRFDISDNTKQCVRAGMFYGLTRHMDGDSYLMKSSCPAKVDRLTTKKCEVDVLDNVTFPSFEDLTPVQSLTDMTIYRNIHCLRCNSLEQNISQWDIWLVCTDYQTPAVYSVHIENPISILKDLVAYVRMQLTGQRSHIDYANTCDVVYEPKPQHKEVANPLTCTKYDVDSCKDHGQIPSVNDVCSKYTSPIEIYDSTKMRFIFYKNAACVRCNGLTSLTSWCRSSTTIRLVRLKLNVPSRMTQIRTNEILNGVLRKFDQGASIHNCLSGEIYDSQSDICRQVFCPHGMFAFDGKCQFVFDTIEDAPFKVYLQVKPQKLYNGSNNINIFASVLYNWFVSLDEEKDLFHIEDLSVWHKPGNDFFVYLVFKTGRNSNRFPDAIHFINSLLTTSMIKTDDKVVEKVSISIATTVRYYPRTFKNLHDDEFYSLLYPKAWRKKLIRVSIPVSEINFCYRVRLLEEESKADFYSMTASFRGKTIYNFIESKAANDKWIFVCKHHVIAPEQKTKLLFDSVPTYSRNTTSSLSNLKEYLNSVIGLYVMTIMLFIVVLLLAYRTN